MITRQASEQTIELLTKYLLLKHYLTNNELKKPINAWFVDFSKAFDSVWRGGLFQKLHKLGVKVLY